MSPEVQWTPESVAAQMRVTVDRLEKAAKIVSNAHDAYLAAKREWTVAKAVGRQAEDNKGSRDDRDDRSTLLTMDLYMAMDTASVAYTYARDLSNTLEKKLSALQTEARLILAEYAAVGKM